MNAIKNIREALQILGSNEWDEGDIAWVEGLLDEALKELENK